MQAATSTFSLATYLVEGVPVEIQRPDGSFGGDRVRIVDFDTPEENEFLVVNQFAVVENKHERRPDVVVFLNGLPIAVFELKNAVDEKADPGKAFNQRQTYKNFKNPEHPFKIVIVRDMWLTGFDAPCMHTMCLDKPMRGHGLMQAIARVNRVFKDKPGGLVVDYLGIAEQLNEAVNNYTDNGGTGDAVPDKGKAIAILQEKYEICCDLFHGFDFSSWKSGMYVVPVIFVLFGYVLLKLDSLRYFDATVAVLNGFPNRIRYRRRWPCAIRRKRG